MNADKDKRKRAREVEEEIAWTLVNSVDAIEWIKDWGGEGKSAPMLHRKHGQSIRLADLETSIGYFEVKYKTRDIGGLTGTDADCIEDYRDLKNLQGKPVFLVLAHNNHRTVYYSDVASLVLYRQYHTTKEGAELEVFPYHAFLISSLFTLAVYGGDENGER